jgi:hypothetical protein
MGYEGAYSTLTEYLRLIRPVVPRQFERRFETPAGKQAQVDFAEFISEPGVMRKVWLFSMVLGHSRWLWGRFCPNQTLETVMSCHIAAFGAMGGACSEILYDRMKTAVIGEDAAGVVTHNESLVALLAHYGSAPRSPARHRWHRRLARASVSGPGWRSRPRRGATCRPVQVGRAGFWRRSESRTVGTRPGCFRVRRSRRARPTDPQHRVDSARIFDTPRRHRK